MSIKEQDLLALVMGELSEKKTQALQKELKSHSDDMARFQKMRHLLDGLEDLKAHRQEEADVPPNYWYFFRSRLKDRLRSQEAKRSHRRSRQLRYQIGIVGAAVVLFLVFYQPAGHRLKTDQAGVEDLLRVNPQRMNVDLYEMDRLYFGPLDDMIAEESGGDIADATTFSAWSSQPTNELVSLDYTMNLLDGLGTEN